MKGLKISNIPKPYSPLGWLPLTIILCIPCGLLVLDSQARELVEQQIVQRAIGLLAAFLDFVAQELQIFGELRGVAVDFQLAALLIHQLMV